jgi:hypothetical protein
MEESFVTKRFSQCALEDVLLETSRTTSKWAAIARKSPHATSFAAYVALMRNVNSQNLTVAAMEPCRQQICSVLYGVHNPDVSEYA